jgi:hypothetical protein
MALPVSRNQTFADGSTPWIDAATMNALQDQNIGDVQGTISKKALVVDGTGGNTVSPSAGSAYAKHFVGNSGTPTTANLGTGISVGGTPIVGNDFAGLLAFTVATGGTGAQIDVNFATSYGAAPHAVVLFPAGTTSATNWNTAGFYVGSALSTGHFTINAVGTPPDGTYQIFYIVGG